MASKSNRGLKEIISDSKNCQEKDQDEDEDNPLLRELAIDVDLQPIELTKEEEETLTKGKLASNNV